MSNRSSHFVAPLQTSLRRSLPAALVTCALTLAFSFTIYAVQAQGQEVTATRDATGENPPARPTNLQASAEPYSVNLTWTASTDQSVTHYAVLRRDRNEDDAGVFHVIDSNAGSGLSYTDDSVSPGGSYVYRVKAVSPTGVSQWSSYAEADTPPDPVDLAPSNLTARPVAGPGAEPAGVELAWDAPAEDAASVTGYEILRAVGDGDLATLVADTGSADTSYSDATATGASETYIYAVIARRGGKKSQQSNLATVGFPPARPTGLTTAATHDAVTLSWDDPGDDSITHYQVYRRATGEDAQDDSVLIESGTGSADTTYIDDDISPATGYDYQVGAVNAHGASQRSQHFSVTTPPDPADLAPSNLTARPVAGPGAEPAGVELAWDAPAEDAASVTGYEILRAVGDGDLATLVADIGSADTSYSDATATKAGESYAYRVKALRGEEKSQPSGQTEASIPKVTPVEAAPRVAEEQNAALWSATLTVGDLAPSGYGCSNVVLGKECSSLLDDDDFTYKGTTYQITLLFTANSYLSIFFADDLGEDANSFVLNAGDDMFAFQDGTARANARDWFSVGFGWSDGESVSLSITTTHPAATAAPTVEGVSGTTNSLSVSWTAPDNTGKPDISSYDLRYRKGNGGDWTNGPQDVTETTAAINGLDADSAYLVQVRATNANGDGEWSQSGSGRTLGVEVPSNWSLKPSGLGTGDSFRLIFATSGTRDATSTDIDDYNTFVQNAAASGHASIQEYSAGFRVVGSTGAVDARDNTGTTHTDDDKGVPIYWLNGYKVADDYEDFYDGSWDVETYPMDEGGAGSDVGSSVSTAPHTGSLHDGTLEAPLAGDPLGLGYANVRAGFLSASGGPLQTVFVQTRGSARPFWALSQTFSVGQASADTGSGGTAVQDDHGNTPETATLLPGDSSESRDFAFSLFPDKQAEGFPNRAIGEITPVDDVDYFRIDIDESIYVVIWTDPMSTLFRPDLTFVLLDESGECLIDRCPDKSEGHSLYRLPVGTYYLRVSIVESHRNWHYDQTIYQNILVSSPVKRSDGGVQGRGHRLR